MGYRYTKKKIDLNQNDIVDKLRSLGISVALDHDDILVGYNKTTYWFEIKSELALNKSGGIKKTSIRKSQIELRREWRGQYHIVSCVDQILDIIKFNGVY